MQTKRFNKPKKKKTSLQFQDKEGGDENDENLPAKTYNFIYFFL